MPQKQNSNPGNAQKKQYQRQFAQKTIVNICGLGKSILLHLRHLSFLEDFLGSAQSAIHVMQAKPTLDGGRAKFLPGRGEH